MTDTVDALQRALTVEHRSIYAYGLLGGRLTGTPLARAQTAYAVHENRRDAISRLIRLRGETPVHPAAAYAPRRPVGTSRAARSLAVELEDACAAAYAGVLAGADPSVRAQAIGWLRDAAVRGVEWRATLGIRAVAQAPPLPGLAPVSPPAPAVTPPTTPG